MATKVPKPNVVAFLVRCLREAGGAASTAHLMHSFQTRYGYGMRCLASFISDCRKLGAVIEYDSARDRYVMISEPTSTVPLQENIDNLIQAIHYAENWLERRRRGQMRTDVVRQLIREIKKYREIPPRKPVERDDFLDEIREGLRSHPLP